MGHGVYMVQDTFLDFHRTGTLWYNHAVKRSKGT